MTHSHTTTAQHQPAKTHTQGQEQPAKRAEKQHYNTPPPQRNKR
ncbi:hypothetical protein [Jonesia quinghaiensis]|nr:hypothetical protein [Jonesia quinghaiensis]